MTNENRDRRLQLILTWLVVLIPLVIGVASTLSKAVRIF
ncbi:MFS transporter small subunit [Arhodomonas sp. AD133]